MYHHLPSLEKLIAADFHILQTKNEHVSSAKLPLFISEEPFYYDNESKTWKRSTFIDSKVCIADILPLLKRHHILIVKDETGEIIGYLSAYKVCEGLLHSLQYVEAFFQTVLDTVDASITAIDEHSIVQIWTEGAENIFSYKQCEVIGKPITDFFNMDHLEITQTLQKGKKLHGHQHKAREDLTVLINSSPVYLKDKIVGAVVSETDITRQVRLNQELFNVSSKMHQLEQKVAKLSPPEDPFQKIKGSSQMIKNTIERAKKVCVTEAPVLILGESGVGKELFAKAIHETREKGNAPFIPINCGAIPSSLFESELFGYEKGAFSGADSRGKKGKIELARGGTLFLDEIGEMPLDMQVKLLRVLQEKRYFPVGGTKEIDADFRVIAATNRDLAGMVNDNKFREDLYYRLNIVNIRIPPLRERYEDVIELSHFFFYEFSVRYNRQLHGISQDIMQEFLRYEWPGNIRELRNMVERLVVFATDGYIKREDLGFSPVQQDQHKSSLYNSEDDPRINLDPSLSLSEQLGQYEKKIILDTLKQNNGNKQAAANQLGITRVTLYNRMKKLDI
ncbi:sigma-54 interaction domain-containing protein [Scopulibacillus cellulosilyticus]|uniref:Sigma-54 interaction domain-containing protein n=1 Tax=Scopulibacillus cellulosilyticus TaxID=2665665 RepID=A0ABW2Q1P5_9BACL